MRILSDEAGSFHIMNRGDLELARLHRWRAASAFFVTRAKHNFRFCLRPTISPI
jgi:hypothetical protein